MPASPEFSRSPDFPAQNQVPNEVFREPELATDGCDPRSQLNLLMDRLRANPADARLGDLAVETATRLSDANAVMDILEIQARSRCDMLSWLKAGMFCMQFQKFGRTIDCYEHALELDPRNKDILAMAAEAASAIGRFGLAVTYCERILDGLSPTLLPPPLLSIYTRAYANFNKAGRLPGDILREYAPYLRNNPATLRALIGTAAICCEHRLVHELNLYFIEHWPTADLLPYDWVVWLRAIKHMDDTTDLDRVADAALRSLDGLLSRNTFPLHNTLPDIHMARARILYLAGRNFRPALDQCLSQPGCSRNLASLASTAPLAQQAYRANFERWQARFKGCDVLLLANGPSLQALEAHRDALRSNEMLRFVVFNDFDSVFGKILAPAGRSIDAFCTMASEALEQQEDKIVGLLGSAARPFLISTPVLINAQRRSDDILRFADQMMLVSSHLCLPPTPGNGLNFEISNTLSVVISLFLTAEPRRIFLFGADGGRSTYGQTVYFGGKQIADMDESVAIQEVYFDRLKAEAEMMDEILAFQLPVAAGFYGVKVPEIYNVCPTSNYHLFEKIDIETAVAMLDQSDAEPLYKSGLSG